MIGALELKGVHVYLLLSKWPEMLDYGEGSNRKDVFVSICSQVYIA